MRNKIIELYKKIRDISAAYMIYQDRYNIEMIREIIPLIQEFVSWFLEENRFGIEQELYRGLCENLLNIVNDILTAIEAGDRVLMNDAIAYGLIEYLEMFVGEDVANGVV